MKTLLTVIISILFITLSAQKYNQDKEERARITGITLTTGAAVFTIAGVGLAAGGYVKAKGYINSDIIPPYSNLRMIFAGAVLTLASIPLWVAGPVELGRARHLRNGGRRGVSLSLHPDIANAAISGFQPTPTLGMKITF